MFPAYESIEDPCLCFIYLDGGADHQVRARDTYPPLADHFGLSPVERSQPRPDGRDEPLWNNMVQWARRKLKDKGYLESSPHGTWKLSDAGVFAAQRACSAYLQLRR